MGSNQTRVNLNIPFKPQTKDELSAAIKLYDKNKPIAIQQYGFISDWDVSLITDMSEIFEYLSDFDENLNNWDTSNVTDMSYMFRFCKKFNNGGQPLEFDTSNVTDMRGMFSTCSNLNVEIRFNTIKVIDMFIMFFECVNFNNSGQPLYFNTINVKDMFRMFFRCYSLNVEIRFNTINVLDIRRMFQDCIIFNNGAADFEDSEINYLDFDTSKVDRIKHIMSGCPKFNRVCYWNLDNVTDLPILKSDDENHLEHNQILLRNDNNMILAVPNSSYILK